MLIPKPPRKEAQYCYPRYDEQIILSPHPHTQNSSAVHCRNPVDRGEDKACFVRRLYIPRHSPRYSSSGSSSPCARPMAPWPPAHARLEDTSDPPIRRLRTVRPSVDPRAAPPPARARATIAFWVGGRPIVPPDRHRRQFATVPARERPVT